MASPTKKKRRTAAQLAADGFAAIVQKLGMADAVRYVQLYHQGSGDYTRERHEWLDDVRNDQIVNLMASTEKKGSRKRKRGDVQKAGHQAHERLHPPGIAAGPQERMNGDWRRRVLRCASSSLLAPGQMLTKVCPETQIEGRVGPCKRTHNGTVPFPDSKS